MPERLIETLVRPEGQLVMRFEQFTAQGSAGDESRSLFNALRTRLQREAQLVLRETGLRTLWLAYPVLFVPAPTDPTEFLLAPLFLWPIRILASGMAEGELVFARDKDGGAPRFNRVAAAWIRRSLEFEPREPVAAEIREMESLSDVEAVCRRLGDSFRPPIDVALSGGMQPIPSRDRGAALRQPAVFNSGLLGLVQWENQELIQDLEVLGKAESLEGVAGDLIREPGPRVAAAVPVPEERDRYLITDTDASQERAIWMARNEAGVVVHGPPGTGKSQVIVNIVADALARGQTVLVVCQKKAALDVVAARLRASGLEGLCLQVNDAEADRRRIIESLKSQLRPDTGEFEEERRVLAETIRRLESELDGFRRALFDLRQTRGLSYRRMIGRVAALRNRAPKATAPERLRGPLASLGYEEVQRLGRLFGELEDVHRKADPRRNLWRHARPDISAAPDEREHLAEILCRLETAATEAEESGIGPGARRWRLSGDLAAIVERATELRRTLTGLLPAQRRPPRGEQVGWGAAVEAGYLTEAAACVETLTRWQASGLRALVPAYHRARRRFKHLVTQFPWLAASDAPEVLDYVEQRARAVGVVIQKLEPLREWLEDRFLLDLEEAARRGESIAGLVATLRQRLPTIPALIQWRAMERGLAPLERQVLDLLIDCEIGDDWATCIELGALTSWLREAEQQTPILRAMSPELYSARKGDLAAALARKRELEPRAITSSWGRKWDQADLRWRHGLAVRGSHSRRLREIVEVWRQGLMTMRPCWLMNPGTVSQLLPLQPGLFDLVVFDEASQCPPEYAISSLYRGRRAVVAGDGKQLPPTIFFKSAFDFDEEDEPAEEITEASEIADHQAYAVTTGAEDLLALAQARLPEAHLNVHYRSRDPRLIAFSNAAFYGNRLQIPQAATPIRVDGAPALSLVRVDGRYSSARVNQREAEAVVKCIRSIWAGGVPCPTLGVVTFNEPQQQLILDLLDDLARRDPAFSTRYSQELARQDEGQDVGFFVKNLEAVQGDERDVMLFSTTYGPREDRPFSRAFLGPLNQAGGERRLNVAISRAKLWVRIFTSLPIEQVADAMSSDTVPTGQGLGRAMLQLYLLYAEAVTRGSDEAARAILERAVRVSGYVMDPAESRGTEDSEFEVDVAEKIRTRLGYRVDPQVGSGAFRIDLAVRHPEDHGCYVLGIECDGRAYHTAPTARAYDLWRQRILEDRGWRIHRIWSTAWRQDPEGELEKIERVMREQLAARRQTKEQIGIRDIQESLDTVSLPGSADHELNGNDGAKPAAVPRAVEIPNGGGVNGASATEPSGPQRAVGVPNDPVAAGPAPQRRSPARSSSRPASQQGRAGDKLTASIAEELPTTAWKCPKCSARSKLEIGRYGPFLKCATSGCQHNVSVEVGVLGKVLQALGITCPKCGAQTVAAQGPLGKFVGCSKYPQCRAGRSWLELRDEVGRGRR